MKDQEFLNQLILVSYSLLCFIGVMNFEVWYSMKYVLPNFHELGGMIIVFSLIGRILLYLFVWAFIGKYLDKFLHKSKS
jgi:hypothetical protein